MKKVLLTDRLKLVPVETKNCDLLFSMLRNNKIKKYLCDNKNIEKETVAEIIGSSETLFEEKNVGLWLIHYLKERSVIGYCGFISDNALELIYVIHPDFQNKGFATEASLKVIHHLTQNHAEDLYAKIDLPNLGSHTVAKKLGMKEIGIEKNEVTGGDMKVYKL